MSLLTVPGVSQNIAREFICEGRQVKRSTWRLVHKRNNNFEAPVNNFEIIFLKIPGSSKRDSVVGFSRMGKRIHMRGDKRDYQMASCSQLVVDGIVAG